MPIDNTELDVIIPELWSSDLLAGTYQEAQVSSRVDRKDAEVSAYGDIIHMPALPQVSVNNVTAATGAVTDQDLTLTEQQLTVDKWKEATFQIVDKAAKQAKLNAIESFRKEFPRALVEQMESDILGLYSDVSTYSQGDSASNANEDLVTAAIGNLMDAKFGGALRDPNRVSLVFHTSQWKFVKKLEGWSSANITGESIGGALKMDVPNLYGIPTYFNASVVSASSARQNLLFLREAFALGVQKNIEFKELVSTGLARRFCANALYGVKTRAEARAVLIKTKA